MKAVALPARYEAIRKLGKGQSGQVWLVQDLQRNEQVALKISMANDPEAQVRFRQEYWVLAMVQHPSLPAVHDFGVGPDGLTYFTMDYIEGQPPSSGGSEASVQAWLPGVMGALDALHQNGYVHANLQATSIRIRPDGTGVLLDSGLNRRVWQVASVPNNIETVSPEMILRRPLVPASDYYALGCVLYRVLAGRPVFILPAQSAKVRLTSTLPLLRSHVEKEPVPLRKLCSDVSTDLESFVTRLLDKEPARRQSAVDELLKVNDSSRCSESACKWVSNPIIGSSALRAHTALRSEAYVNLVGPAGSGKSRLLGEAIAQQRLAGRTVLQARGLGVFAPPYLALRPWFETLLSSLPDAAQRRFAPVIARVMPVAGVEPALGLENGAEQLRLAVTLFEMASFFKQPVWVVDDADQLDAASLDLVRLVEASARERGWYWYTSACRAVFASFGAAKGRIEQAPLAIEESLNQYELVALTAHEALEFAQNKLGLRQLPAALESLLMRLSGVQPGMLDFLLCFCLRFGLLIREDDPHLAAASEALRNLESPDEVLATLIQFMPAATRRLASVAAFLGLQGDLLLLLKLTNLSDEEFFRALRMVQEGHLLECDGNSFRFGQSIMLPLLRNLWTDEECLELHARAAQYLASLYEDRRSAPSVVKAEVARHTLAGQTADHFPWVLATIEDALAMAACEQALTMIQWVRRALPISEADSRRLVCLELQARQALEQFDSINAFVDAGLFDELVACNDPHLPECLMTYAEALEASGAVETAWPILNRVIALTPGTAQTSLGGRARFAAGRVLYALGEMEQALQILEDAQEISARVSNETLRTAILGFTGQVMCLQEPNGHAIGIELLASAAAGARALSDYWGLFNVLCQLGDARLELGTAREALAAYEEALNLVQRWGSLGMRGTWLPHELDIERLHAAIGAARAVALDTSPSDSMHNKSGDGYQDHLLTEQLVALAAETSLPALYRRAVAALALMTRAQRTFLLLYREHHLVERVAWGAEPGEEEFSSLSAFQILWRQEPVLIEDVVAAGLLEDGTSTGPVSILGVPLCLDGGQTGVLLAESHQAAVVFKPADLAFAQSLAALISCQMHNLSEIQRLSESVSELEIIRDLALKLLLKPDLESRFELIAREALAFTSADRVLFLRGFPPECVAGWNAADECLDPTETSYSLTVPALALERGQPISILETTTQNEVDTRQSIHKLGIRAVLALPFSINEEESGVLYLDGRTGIKAKPGLTNVLRALGHMLATLGELPWTLSTRKNGAQTG